MTRTFIALEFNPALQRALDGFIRQLAAQLPRLSWVKPGGIHLTLAFLGELSGAELQQASLAARQAARGTAPFEYRLSPPGIFGTPRQPRVLWLGIEEPAGRLVQLQRSLTRELRQRDFILEGRPFSPHLTLARCKAPLRADERERLLHILRSRQPPPSPTSFSAGRISVMKSELAPGGATYTTLQEWPLSATP